MGAIRPYAWPRDARIGKGAMHGHTTLMLAAVGVVAAFVPIVVAARWLEAGGRLGDPDRIIPFRSYGPIIAGALSLGTAAIHLSVIGDHAVRSSPTSDPVLFLCTVGVGTAHPTEVDATLLGFLPLGVASLVVAPFQGIWAVPRLWRTNRSALLGAGVAIASLALSIGQLAFGQLIVGPTLGPSRIGEVGTVSLIGEGLLLAAIAVLVLGRPRRLVGSLDARVVDAYIATALTIVGVAIFTLVAIVFGHVGH
jgi:hypothetical protein